MAQRQRPRAFGAGVVAVAVAVAVAVVVLLALAGAALLAHPWDAGAQTDPATDPLVGPAYYANPAAVCGLLEPEELELALGHPYRPGFEAPIDTPALVLMPGMVRCVHPSTRGAGGFVATGVVYAYAQQVFDRTLQARAERDIATIEVDGLGDRAVWSARDLLVVVDDKLVGVSAAIDAPTERDHFVLTRRLAEKAIERLR